MATAMMNEKSFMSEMEILNNKKIVVVGGFPNFHRLIKNKFKNIKTIDSNQLNRSIKHIGDYNLVVFITTHNNHSTWNKMKQVVSKNQLLVLNRQHNVNILAQHMLNKILRQEEVA